HGPPGQTRGRLRVVVSPFARLPRGSMAALRGEAADVGRFLGLAAGLEIAES
ncbi:MAG: hypothetical protein JHC74_15755, partial [Thermoleophilia bacterium]|nr:hypothetical protein [Thermoleophilia bacterium]